MALEKKFKIFYLFIILLCVTSIFYAFFVEFFLGYKPCILCKYQRVPYALGLIIGFFGFFKPSNTKICIYIFLTFLISMILSGYHVGIEQELYQSIFNCSDDNTMQEWGNINTPLGRLGTVSDLIGAAIFLASSASQFMSGQTLRVDGGFTAGINWPIEL